RDQYAAGIDDRVRRLDRGHGPGVEIEDLDRLGPVRRSDDEMLAVSAEGQRERRPDRRDDLVRELAFGHQGPVDGPEADVLARGTRGEPSARGMSAMASTRPSCALMRRACRSLRSKT